MNASVLLNAALPDNSVPAFGESLFAHHALLPDGWQRDVVLRWNVLGDIVSVEVGATPNAAMMIAAGPVIPGMPNLHSHAFQRAMAGLTETRGDLNDSFWSWRTLMYRFAERLSPEHLEAIARYLYIEMLKAGYTSVCEFHYVHHAVGGQPYSNPAEHAERIIAAAQAAGIGLTLLPVLYQYSGFGEQTPQAHQARFVTSPEWILNVIARLKRTRPQHGNLRYGVAPHSLRAVSAASMRTLVEGIRGADSRAPIHIHIAEQVKEVEDCLAAYGRRPVERLLELQVLDAGWCLVHATHMSAQEYADAATSGAVIGLCPTTEANLGDGFFDLSRYLEHKGRWGIGSDSNVSVDLRSELRLLEYGQRLLTRKRNVAASDGVPAVADYLYQQAVMGGASATGRKVAGLCAGERADWLVLDGEHTGIFERSAADILSGFVFCEHGATPVRDVYVGGRAVVKDGIHAQEVAARAGYRAALRALVQ